MSLTQYKDIAGNIAIVMQSVIAENHTVTFESHPERYTINSGGALTFTPANAATPQNLNITPLLTGSINIPYTITSPYTQRTKTGQITITSSPNTNIFLPVGSVNGAFATGGAAGGGYFVCPAGTFTAGGAQIGQALAFGVVDSVNMNGLFILIRQPNGVFTYIAVSNGASGNFTPTQSGLHHIYIASVSSAALETGFEGATSTLTVTPFGGTPVSQAYRVIKGIRTGVNELQSTYYVIGPIGSSDTKTASPIDVLVSASLFGFKLNDEAVPIPSYRALPSCYTLSSFTAAKVSASAIQATMSATLSSNNEFNVGVEARVRPRFSLIDTAGFPSPVGASLGSPSVLSGADLQVYAAGDAWIEITFDNT